MLKISHDAEKFVGIKANTAFIRLFLHRLVVVNRITIGFFLLILLIDRIFTTFFLKFSN